MKGKQARPHPISVMFQVNGVKQYADASGEVYIFDEKRNGFFDKKGDAIIPRPQLTPLERFLQKHAGPIIPSPPFLRSQPVTLNSVQAKALRLQRAIAMETDSGSDDESMSSLPSPTPYSPHG